MNVIMENLGKYYLWNFSNESNDISCKEQLALVLWFENKERKIIDMFVGLGNVTVILALTLKGACMICSQNEI